MIYCVFQPMLMMFRCMLHPPYDVLHVLSLIPIIAHCVLCHMQFLRVVYLESISTCLQFHFMCWVISPVRLVYVCACVRVCVCVCVCVLFADVFCNLYSPCSLCIWCPPHDVSSYQSPYMPMCSYIPNMVVPGMCSHFVVVMYVVSFDFLGVHPFQLLVGWLAGWLVGVYV